MSAAPQKRVRTYSHKEPINMDIAFILDSLFSVLNGVDFSFGSAGLDTILPNLPTPGA